MIGFLKKLMPREDKFFDLFEAHAVKSLAAAKYLAAIFEGGKNIAAKMFCSSQRLDSMGFKQIEELIFARH